MNVVLAHPQWFTQRPIQPMGLLYLASVLRQAGHRVRIIDGEVERIDHVQVYTVARAPSDPRCGPLDPARLDAIAAVARTAGLAAAVYA
jgi:hypothetical protein